jgi:hypothetical protein
MFLAASFILLFRILQCDAHPSRVSSFFDMQHHNYSLGHEEQDPKFKSSRNHICSASLIVFGLLKSTLL